MKTSVSSEKFPTRYHIAPYSNLSFCDMSHQGGYTTSVPEDNYAKVSYTFTIL